MAILAAMVADPALMGLHDKVFQQLVVQKDYREDKLAWPRVSWPFSGPIALTLAVRKGDGEVCTDTPVCDRMLDDVSGVGLRETRVA